MFQKAAITAARGALYALVGEALTNHVSVPEVIAALTRARLRHTRRTDMSSEALGVFSSAVYDYITEVVM